jgi:hypothetical protein
MPKAHPLQSLGLLLFAERGCHDASSLGYALAGAYVQKASSAYRTVARDLLGCMEQAGLIYRDACGWYRLAPAGDAAVE